MRKLQALQQWLAQNHKPVTLFRADGRPRSEIVCLAVPVEDADKALAWRAPSATSSASPPAWCSGAPRPTGRSALEPPFKMEFD